MPTCSRCKRNVDDIRPQIEGVGVCIDCAGKPLTREAIDRWRALKNIKNKES